MCSVKTERTFCPQIVDRMWVTYPELCTNLWISVCITIESVDKLHEM